MNVFPVIQLRTEFFVHGRDAFRITTLQDKDTGRFGYEIEHRNGPGLGWYVFSAYDVENLYDSEGQALIAAGVDIVRSID